MQNNIPTVYISEIYCSIVKSTNLSTILQFCTKNMKKFKEYRHRILHITIYTGCIKKNATSEQGRR